MLRRVVLLIVPAVVSLLVSGCGPSQRSVENAIREGVKSKLGVSLTTLELKKKDDGSYGGSATAENGDAYDITTHPIKDNRVEWNAIPGQALVEKMVRDGLEQQLKTKVQSLQLTKNGPGLYTGPAELASGSTVTVTTRLEGSQLLWEAKPAQP